MIQVQYASDLHLEFFKGIDFATLLKPVAPILVLAGDIGPAGAQNTRDFLSWCSERWRHVIWVFGNHEYYIMYSQKRWKFLEPEKVRTMAEREAAARVWLAALPNVHFLQGETVDLEGIRFFGATLWTHVSDEVHAEYGDKIADFRAIIAERSEAGEALALRNPFRNRLHEEHLAALRKALATPFDGPLVVVTHHLPVGLVAPAIYHGEPTNPYYSNELWPELKSGRVNAWICGHSHGRTIMEKPCLCVLNARGYPKQQVPENPYTNTAVIRLNVAVNASDASLGSGCASSGVNYDGAATLAGPISENGAASPPQSDGPAHDAPSPPESDPVLFL
jgi:hypothetical protein